LANLKITEKIIILSVSAAAIISVIITQLAGLNPYVSSWDQVDFSLAMDRYDLRAMQPHFPGYPYFILGGMLSRAFVGEPHQALLLFNVLIYASSIIPLFLLARRLLPSVTAILAAAAVYTSSYTLIIVNQPMSEGAALAIVWWFIWSIVSADERGVGIWTWLPLFLFSILLGIRLSYIPMGIGLVFLFYRKWKEEEIDIAGLVKYVLIAAAFQSIWVGALILTEGGFMNFIELALGFTGGHFQEWGGTASSNGMPFFERINALLFINIFWWGIFSRSGFLMVIYIFVGMLLLVSRKNRIEGKKTVFRLAATLMVSYAIWALFAQNVEKARHVLPIVLLIVFMAVTALLQWNRNRLGILLVAVLICAQSVVSAGYIKAQAGEEPAVYQLAHFLGRQDVPSVLYTWEETRVLEYLESPFSHKRVYTYDVFLQDKSLYKDREIFLTGSVVKGFEAQGYNVTANIKKVKTFHSREIFDPVYHEIILYKWIP